MLDIVAVLTDQDNYIKTRNYWKHLKNKLKKEKSEVVSATTQLKLYAPDGKKRLTDVFDYNGIIELGKQFPSKISKIDYINAMIKSRVNSSPIKELLENALTDQIDSREMFI